MSVIGGPNNPISNGLVYALDFKNQRSYVSGSSFAKNLFYSLETSSFLSVGTGPIPNLINGLLEFNPNTANNPVTGSMLVKPTNIDALGFGNKEYTIQTVIRPKGANLLTYDSVLFAQGGGNPNYLTLGASILGVSMGSYTPGIGDGGVGRTYAGLSQLAHVTFRYKSGSYDLFVNGVPVSSSLAVGGASSAGFSTPGLGGALSGGTFNGPAFTGSVGNFYVYSRALTNDEIRTNYTLASREYGLPTPPSFSIDENAYLFSQTAGITSSAYISALDTFVRGLKSASLWDKMVGIYPFLGGNNTLNQLNLKESSLTVYPASFTGSWSSSFSGSRSNTTASFATLTGFTPSTYHPLINTQSFHMAYLSYDTPANSGSLMGATNQVIASGGQVFDISGSRFHVFTASANLTVTQGGPVQAFVVAGGGGGGNHGGGGAGGVRYLPVNVPQGTTSVTVGLGGTAGLNGQNSTFSTITSAGGGGGGSFSSTGSSGGSGGGGGTNSGSGNIPTTNPAQGFDGGLSLDAFTGAGGGGASEKAPNPTIHRTGGRGGSGSFFSQFVSTGYGSPAGWFGGGGGGGAYNEAGLGGIGGGGAGNINGPDVGRTGSVNTGGGGGAGYYQTGGSGGSGIIIVSYPINTGSVLLNATPSDISGSINNTDVNGFFAGGPLGLVMTSRTGSRAYSVSKNKVIFNYTSSASSSISNNILLNAVNVNGTASFPIQNNVAYASVGAGLTDNEVRTYYDLVDTFQASLGRKNFDTGSYITMWDTRLTGSGTTDSASVALYLGYGSQAFTASWGDGTTSIISQSNQVDRTHTYATPGRYLISIIGTASFDLQYFNPDRRKLLDIVQYGTNHISYGGFRGVGNGAYAGAINLVGTAADAPIISTPNTSFYYALNGGTFRGNVDNWDTRNVTSLVQCFQNNTVFNQPVGNWNVEKVTSMENAFAGCTIFNNGGSTNINNWRPISCSNFNTMFQGANAFNQPIGNWPLSASNITLNSMFQNNISFNQNIGAWDVSRVSSMVGMFFYGGPFNNGGSPDINNWRPTSCTSFGNTFSVTNTFNQPLGNWVFSTSSAIDMGGMFYAASIFNQNLGAWNVEKVTNMSSLFYNSAFNNSGSTSINNWRPISCSNFSNMFRSAPFNQPIGNWPLSASNINMSEMFSNATSFNQNIGSWDVSKVTTMNRMFESATAFNNSGSNTINNWRPISCSNFTSMFQSATAFNQPIGNWPLSASDIYTTGMFRGANSFNQNIGSWDVSRVVNMDSMFRGNTAFNNSGSSDINNWNTGNVTSMEYTFAGYSVFNQPIGNWNTSKVTNMSGMFEQSTVFNQPIGTWDVSSVTSMQGMFNIATAFNQNISTWNTSKVTNMSSMFKDATAFNQNLGSWLIPSCSNMVTMLNNCGMDKANYSATLQGWAAQAPNIKSNVTLGANGRQYDTPGSASRAILTSSPYNWNITGDTFVP